MDSTTITLSLKQLSIYTLLTAATIAFFIYLGSNAHDNCKANTVTKADYHFCMGI